MTLFQQFIFIYFVSTTALAGIAVLWRNWLEDHVAWKNWLANYFGVVSKALTCGSCFTFWIALAFVLAFDPLKSIFYAAPLFAGSNILILYLIQWMSFGWGAVFLRFSYVALQETVGKMVHGTGDHHR
jgi:hypothetical protein